MDQIGGDSKKFGSSLSLESSIGAETNRPLSCENSPGPLTHTLASCPLVYSTRRFYLVVGAVVLYCTSSKNHQPAHSSHLQSGRGLRQPSVVVRCAT